MQHCLLLLMEWGSRLRWSAFTHKLLWHKWDASSSFGIVILLNLTINASLWTCFFFHLYVSGSLYDNKPYNLLDVKFPVHMIHWLLGARTECNTSLAARFSNNSSSVTCEWCRNTLLLILMSVPTVKYHLWECMGEKLI